MSARVRLPSFVDQMLRQFKLQLQEDLGPSVRRMVLFGSRARGTGRPGSDVDCLVVVDRRDPDVRGRIYAIATDLSLQHGIDLSVKVYTEEEVTHAVARRHPFVTRVLREGVDL